MTSTPFPTSGQHIGIFVTVQTLAGNIPHESVAKPALESLEGWSHAETEDAEAGAYLVEVPIETWHTLRHEGWLETWALAPNGDRLMISAEASDDPDTP